MMTIQPASRAAAGRATVSAGPQMVSCETCGREFRSRRSDGKVARFCCRACFTAGSSGRNAPGWRDSRNYWTLHVRVRKARGAAKQYACERCGERARDWALRHGLDGRDPADFTPLCRSCHIAYDKPKFGKPMPGELNGSAKLTWEQVREIRALHGTVSNRELAGRYGVSPDAISLIVRGITWKESPAA